MPVTVPDRPCSSPPVKSTSAVSSLPVPVASSPAPAESTRFCRPLLSIPVCASVVRDRPCQSLPVPAESKPVPTASPPVSLPRLRLPVLPVPAVFLPVFAVVAVPFWSACPVFCLVPIGVFRLSLFVPPFSF